MYIELWFLIKAMCWSNKIQMLQIPSRSDNYKYFYHYDAKHLVQ